MTLSRNWRLLKTSSNFRQKIGRNYFQKQIKFWDVWCNFAHSFSDQKINHDKDLTPQSPPQTVAPDSGKGFKQTPINFTNTNFFYLTDKMFANHKRKFYFCLEYSLTDLLNLFLHLYRKEKYSCSMQFPASNGFRKSNFSLTHTSARE